MFNGQKLFFLVEESSTPSNKRPELIEKLRDELLSTQTQTNISAIKCPESGNTLLHQAVLYKNVSVVRLILSLNQNDQYCVQNTVNKDGQSVMEIAEERHVPEIISILKSAIAQHRAKQFVSGLVQRYKKKIEKIKRIVDGDPVPLAGSLPTTVIGGVIRVSGGGAGIASFVTSTVDMFRLNDRLKRAKIIWQAHRVFYGDHFDLGLPNRLTKLLIQDGYEIFSSFEDHLVNKLSLEKWDKDCDKIITECVKRMMSYTEDNHEENMDEEGHFSKCFMKGWTSGMRQDQGEWAAVTKAGVNMRKGPVEDQSVIYFVKEDESSDIDNFGFRKVFKFEMENGFPENYKPIYNLDFISRSSFLLTDKMIAKGIKDLLMKMSIIPKTDSDEEDDHEDIMIQLMPMSGSALKYNIQQHVNPFFRRESEVSKLTTWFTNLDTNIFVVTGCCGIGKTELVRKFATDIDNNFQESANIVFLEGNNLDQSFRQLYCQILYPNSEDKTGDDLFPIHHVVRFCYRYLRQMQTLLILSNVECFDNFEQYLPTSKRFNNIKIVIITKSPQEDWDNLSSDMEYLEVQGLFGDEDDCERFMRPIGGQVNLDIRRLAKLLDYSPLALQQVKNYILEAQENQPNLPSGQIASDIISDFIKAFIGNKGEYSELVQAIFEMEVYGKNILKSWQDLFLNLKEREDGAIALEIINFLSYMYSGPVFLETFMSHHVNDKRRLSNAIQLLSDYKIILKVEETKGLWRIRNLVKKVVRFQNRRNNLQIEKLDVIINHMSYFVNCGATSGCQLSGDYIKHIVFCLSYAIHYDDLIEKYIMNYYDYSKPSNSFLHLLLNHDEFNAVEILLNKLEKIRDEEQDVRKNLIARSKMLADGRTPLHIAVTLVKSEIRLRAIKLFLEWGANVEAKDYQENTALHLASDLGHSDAVRMLLQRDSNSRIVNVRNVYGNTTLDLARNKETASVIETFVSILKDKMKDRKERMVEITRL